MKELKELLPANRIAVIVGALLGIVIVLTSLATNFAPGSPEFNAIGKALGVIAGTIAILKTITVFLYGSQKWDEIQSQQGSSESTIDTDSEVDLEDDEDLDDELELEDDILGDDEDFSEVNPDDDTSDLLRDLPDHPENDIAPNRVIIEADLPDDIKITKNEFTIDKSSGNMIITTSLGDNTKIRVEEQQNMKPEEIKAKSLEAEPVGGFIGQAGIPTEIVHDESALAKSFEPARHWDRVETELVEPDSDASTIGPPSRLSSRPSGDKDKI